MKNRSKFSYALDFAGIVALAAAGLSLGSAIWFAGTALEATLLEGFRAALAGAVAAFLVARMIEIAGLVGQASAQTAPERADSVVPLVTKDSAAAADKLPRAA